MKKTELKQKKDAIVDTLVSSLNENTRVIKAVGKAQKKVLNIQLIGTFLIVGLTIGSILASMKIAAVIGVIALLVVWHFNNRTTTEMCRLSGYLEGYSVSLMNSNEVNDLVDEYTSHTG